MIIATTLLRRTQFKHIFLRTLPKKEHDLYKSVIRFYEEKSYKKGIKAADAVLLKFPNHGETLAMKGLILNSLEKKTEAYELVRSGIKNDARSQVCWHVFGLLHRSDRNYKEAAKCYIQALKIEPENQQILRDLSWLQIQLRELGPYCETRRKLLVLKATSKQHWIAYAVGQYADGNYASANDILQSYFSTSNDVPIKFEHSEVILFQNMCLEKDGKCEEAIQHLKTNENVICDKLSYRVKLGQLHLLLGQFDASLAIWKDLLVEQPDNYKYHAACQCCVLQSNRADSAEILNFSKMDIPSIIFNLNSEQMTSLLHFYENELPPSNTSKLIKLGILRGVSEDRFRQALDEYLKKCLKSGYPALYNDVMALSTEIDVTNSQRRKYATDAVGLRDNLTFRVALDLVNGYIQNLSTNGTFLPIDTSNTDMPPVVPETPTCLMWSYYLRAHLKSCLGQHNEALQDINLSIEHTPTGLDCIVRRARILKNHGDFSGAAVTMDYCRSLDLQDRYLNNKATKYLLRANRPTDAMNTIAMFTKHEGDAEQSLFDLQVIWYELEVGECYERMQQWGLALKKFHAVETHFLEFIEDQFDFHSFCLRKVIWCILI